MQIKDVEEVDNIESFLRDTCNSLFHDVRHAVLYEYSTPDWPTPISALLYCFSVITLLGAFYSGSFENPWGNGALYMKELMDYDDLQIELLEAIYRHKLAHPSQSQFLFHRHAIDYYWEWVDNDRQRHLRLKSHLGSGPMARWFTVSAISLAEDIEGSLFQKDKYVNRLFVNPYLRLKALRIYRAFNNFLTNDSQS